LYLQKNTPYQIGGVFYFKTTLMKNYKNNVQLIGNFYNPEFINQDNGFRLIKFRIITQDIYISYEGSKSKDYMYHVCYAFGKQLEIIERFVNVGVEMAVEGTIINRSLLIGKEEAIETSIHVSDLLILSNKKKYD